MLTQPEEVEQANEFEVNLDYRNYTFGDIEAAFRFVHLITETRQWKEAGRGGILLEIAVRQTASAGVTEGL